MKKIIYAFATVAALTAISCSKETDIQNIEKPEHQVVAEKPATISALVGDVTKVSADNAGEYKWQASDRITVQTKKGNIRTFTAAEAGLATDFSGSIPTTDELDGGFAFYPASDDHVAIGLDDVSFHIPSELTWSADASNMPLFSGLSTVSEKTNASFKAVGGVLKLVCFNIPTGATKLAFTAKSMKICGDFEFDTTSETPWCAGEESSSEKEILIDFADNYSSSKVFYIPLPVVTLTGGFTITIYNDELDELFSVISPKALAVTANKIIVAPALNCANDTVLVSEDFSDYDAEDVPSGTVKGVTYSCTDNGTNKTQIYDAKLAGGNEPELLIGKSGGTFKISGINCKDITTMRLTFKKNSNALTVTATEGITVTGATSGDGTKTITLTNVGTGEPKTPLSSFDLTFAAGSGNVRVDDILLTVPVSYTVPSITTGVATLTVGVGQTSKQTDCTLSNAVDNLGISSIVTGDDTSWIESVVIANDKLILTAKGPNTSGADYTATLTLKATGATNKVVTLKQTNSLVPNPTVSVTPGDSKFSASWDGDSNASSYVAYLRTTDSAPVDTNGDPTSGTTDITNSIFKSEGVYSITDYTATNGQEYFLYVKVNEVSANYTAPSVFVKKNFTPNDATKGTAENPYTVAEAIAAHTLNGGDISGAYVKGIVSTAGFLYGKNNYVCCYISDDGSTTSEFELYNVTSGEGTSDFAVGDAVIAHGKLTVYSEVYELSGTAVDVLVKKPVFTPNGGNFVGSQSVAIASTGSDTIRYTTDGTTPTKTVGTEYSSAIGVSSTTTIKAVGIDEDALVCTAVASATFTKVTGYAITWSTPSNGSITVKHGDDTLISGNEIAAGETITITVSPTSGYTLSTLVYNDGSDHDIKDAKSFTMPSHAVSITATFAAGSSPLDNPSGVTISDISATGFTAKWTNDANATGYSWMLFTSDTAPASTSDASVKAYGSFTSASPAGSGASLSSSTWTLTKTGLSLSGKYYLYVKAVGSGSYTDSGYSSAVKGIITLTQSAMDITSNSYDNGVERACTIASVGFGSVYTLRSGTNIQGQKNNMQIYNTSSLGKIKKIVVTQVTNKNSFTVYAGSSSKPSSTTISGSRSEYVSTYSFTSDYAYFNIKAGSSGAQYISSIEITYE